MATNETYLSGVRKLNSEEEDLVRKYYSKHQNDYKRFGDGGYLLPALYQPLALEIRDMPLRSSDIFVAAFPRSGTTWTQELVWLVANDLDFETASSVPFARRAPFLENSSFINPSMRSNIAQINNNEPEVIQILDLRKAPVPQILLTAPDPRIIKTHLPMSLLPRDVLDTAKVVYVARDPRDVMVSCYYFYTSNMIIGLEAELHESFDLFMKDLTPWGPYFNHVKEAWSQRHHPNLLFLFYEDLSKDLSATARQVAQFLGKNYTDEQYSKLCDFLSFNNFQQSKAVNPKSMTYFLKQNNFIRRGKTGGWRDYFDEEMTKRVDMWMQDNMRDTDLRFPPHPF